jgi:inositol transporter-like SP family MFS transporter
LASSVRSPRWQRARARFDDDGDPTAKHWRWTVLSSLADYIDAGSIVAGAAGLALWSKRFGMSSTAIGLLAAFSSNAISCGVGALIGGRLGDKFGRKRIYSLDLLVFIVGVLIIVFAANVEMLFAGYIIAGLAVGADVPTSWSLIAEFSPQRARGKMMGSPIFSGTSGRSSRCCWLSRSRHWACWGSGSSSCISRSSRR